MCVGYPAYMPELDFPLITPDCLCTSTCTAEKSFILDTGKLQVNPGNGAFSERTNWWEQRYRNDQKQVLRVLR